MASNNSSFLARIVISARDEASAVFSSLQAKVAGVAAAIAGFFGAALFKSSVDSAREFESAMAAVQAAAGATADELAELEAAAKEAGTTTQYSSVEAANALEELVKAGLSASDAVKALPAALDLATAGSVGLAEAAGYITQAVAGMGLSFEDAGRVADVLAQGANATKTSVEGLGQALSYAAPIANSLGLSLEETVGYLGKFADAGIDASRSGTALNSILAQFIDPASKFSEALRASGIRTRDFNEAIRQMAAAGPRASAALLAVGTEAGPALRALLNQGIGALDDLVDKLEQSQGSARTFAEVMSSNLNGAFKGLGSAWEALKIELGQPVLETLARQVAAVADRLRAFVSDGTAKQFGETIREAFESAGKWASEFFGLMNFAKASADMRQYATDLKNTFGEIGNSASAGAGYVGAFFNALQLGFQSLAVGVTLIRERALALYATILSGAAEVADGLSQITFGDLADGYTSTAAKIRAEVALIKAKQDELIASSDEAFAAMEKNGEELFASYERAEAGANKAAAATAGLGSSAAGAVPAVDSLGSAAAKLAAETALAGKSFAELGISSQQVAAKLAEISAQTGVTVTSTRELKNAVADGSIAFNEAAGAWGKGVVGLNGLTVAGANAEQALVAFKAQTVAAAKDSKTLADQTGDTAAKIAQLTAQYKEFIAAGDTQGAAGVLVQIEALKELGRQAGATAGDLEQVETAFKTLGIKSQAELKRTAEVAKEAFETIRASGSAAPRDIEAAFKAYATAAIEANGGVADASLKSEAAMAGMRIEADETGKTVVRTLEASREAAIDLAEATDAAADGMGDIAEASDAVADAQSSAASATDKLSNANVVATGTWMTAAGAASKYAGEAREAAWAIHQASNYTSDLTASFAAYVAGMEALDRQQNAINSNGARGLEDLKLRWLELNGTEEEIAAARHRRDEADMQRQIALLQIESKRAARRGEDVSVLKEEIALMKEQLTWLDKIFKEEEKQRKARAAEAEKEEKRRARERREAERERNKPSDDSDSSSGGSPEPTRPSSNTGGGNLGGTPNTNTGNRPAAPTGPIVNIHLGGVLDVNDPVTLDSLGRKLRPVFANLDRKGF